MAVKSEAVDAFFADNEDQLEIAKSLDECFDVTFGSRREQLSLWFCAPKNFVRERFGVNKEIIAIYSPFKKIDARVFNAIHHVAKDHRYHPRVDQVIALIIHRGDENELERLIEDEREWMIIPFTQQELRENSDDFFIRSRIENSIAKIDLFNASSPIKDDKYLFGREETVQLIKQRTLIQKEFSGLFGLRKTGKTSVLYSLRSKFINERCLAVYRDVQTPALHHRRWWSLLDLIAQDIITEAKAKNIIFSQEFRINSIRDANKFSNLIKEILNNDSINQVIIMIDEIEYITPGVCTALGKHWDDDFIPFWQALRAIFQELEGRFIVIVAGVNPLIANSPNFISGINPIFQLMSPIFLKPMSRENVKQMVRFIGRYAGLNFDDNVYDYLRLRFGGHPYLTRIACSEVWRHVKKSNDGKNLDVQIDDFVNIENFIKSRVEQPMKDILLSLVWWYPEEFELLRAISDSDAEFCREYLGGMSDGGNQFFNYGILKNRDGDFEIEDMRSFLVDKGLEYRSVVNPFKKSDFPPDVLPEVPDVEKLSKLFEWKVECEINLRRGCILILNFHYKMNEKKVIDALLKGLSKSPSQQNHNPRSIFMGRKVKDVMNELYTTDLKHIIVANWSIFGGFFGDNKNFFESVMDTINLARRYDSHTKPISDDDFNQFEVSYNWLRKKLIRLSEI